MGLSKTQIAELLSLSERHWPGRHSRLKMLRRRSKHPPRGDRPPGPGGDLRAETSTGGHWAAGPGRARPERSPPAARLPDQRRRNTAPASPPSRHASATPSARWAHERDDLALVPPV